MADQGVKLFLSCVSDEFGVYRDALRHALTRPNVEVKIQEDFKLLGGDTLRMLEEYIEQCQAIVHFAGEMTGAAPAAASFRGLCERPPDLKDKLSGRGVTRDALAQLSYTQWEAWLAIYFGKDLVIVEPAPGADRGVKFAPTDASRASQTGHLKRLKAIDCYPGPAFTSVDNLVAQIFASAVIDALVRAAAMPARKPRNLPYASLGALFMGRSKALNDLREALAHAETAAVVGRALHGLGGVGKTRLAIEYALRHEADYSALLFVRADDPATLNTSLAALTGPSVLDLKEKEEPQDAVKIEDVLRWLDAHPTWLMILDNVDDEKAVAAVDKLIARLSGGHVIITARASEFPAHLRTFELGKLDPEPATQFLLDRTQDKRAVAHDDAVQARALADELDGLALGLEQAGAYIERQRIGFARYLVLWQEKRESVLKWFDRTTMSYDHDVGLAATWATSVDKLTPESRRLMDRLAFLAPDLIPDTLIDVVVPGEEADYDAHEARAGLFAYSLTSSPSDEDGVVKGFMVHPLVQDFARRVMTPERQTKALREALAWTEAAFVDDPIDVRSWSKLDPLAPHVLAVAWRADEAAVVDPTGRLFNQLALLLTAKARYVEAERLFRRALTIFEMSLGTDQPQVATCLNNLAELLRETNRLGEAEPLYRRALAIDEASFGPDDPSVAIVLSNLAHLLRAMNQLGEAEQLMRRSLAIDEARCGRDHPNVAIRLNNLAGLLQATNRLGEAEQAYRRALAIDEAHYGRDHATVAIRLNNLASLLQATNRPGVAERLYRRALAIDKAHYGPDHPNVAIRLDNLGGLLQAMNRLGEAEPLARCALAIFEKNLGADHPRVAICLNNLAMLLQATNRPSEAEPLYRRALAIDEASSGPDHPDVGRDLNNLGGLLHAMNRPGEAEPLFRRALAIFQTRLGPAHPNTVTVRGNLAAL